MLKHYNIAAVMTDSPSQNRLQFLSEVIVTANDSIRLAWQKCPSKIQLSLLYRAIETVG